MVQILQNNPIRFQDDEASIHRPQKVQKKVAELFDSRISIENQAPKLDDVWVIENVWGIIAEKLRFRKFTTLKGLRRAICQIWRDIDVSTCRRLVHSLPFRFKEVINKGGHRIGKFSTKSVVDVMYKK